MKKKYFPYLIFLCILFCFAVTRLWHLDTLPSGLHLDEAGMAYDAWCLSHYGVDRFLISFPVYLINYGGGQSALYAYLCAGLFKLFGYSIWLVRLPAVVFSLLNLVFGMKLAKRVYPDNKYLPLAVGTLLTICPYLILNSRYGLDCSLMLGASTVFLYLLVTALQTGKKRYYVAAGVAGGILLYTYVLTYIVVPIFLLLVVAYTIWMKRFSLKGWILMAIPMGLLALPLILVVIINTFGLEEIRLGIFTITKFDYYRSSELHFFHFEFLIQALKNIFIGDELVYNCIPGFPNLYFISIPLFVLGLCSVAAKCVLQLKKRSFSPMAFVLFWFLANLILESHILTNTYRISAIFFAVILITIEGVCTLCKAVGKFAYLCGGAVGIIYLVCFIQFGLYYFSGQYTADYYPLPHFEIAVSEAIDFLDENPQYKHGGAYMAEPVVYFALSSLRSPYDISSFDAGTTFDSYYTCGTLPEIKDGYNYIVRDIYADYANELRAAGYQEQKYAGYSLFYQE